LADDLVVCQRADDFVRLGVNERYARDRSNGRLRRLGLDDVPADVIEPREVELGVFLALASGDGRV
jgi:hypothetical protein